MPSTRIAQSWQPPCTDADGEEASMLNNRTYNLMETAAVISKGLARYDTFIKDAGDCQECREIWTEMKRADEAQLQRIVPHLRTHLDRDEGMKKAA
jgi:hypothetical protein